VNGAVSFDVSFSEIILIPQQDLLMTIKLGFSLMTAQICDDFLHIPCSKS